MAAPGCPPITLNKYFPGHHSDYTNTWHFDVLFTSSTIKFQHTNIAQVLATLRCIHYFSSFSHNSCKANSFTNFNKWHLAVSELLQYAKVITMFALSLRKINCFKMTKCSFELSLPKINCFKMPKCRFALSLDKSDFFKTAKCSFCKNHINLLKFRRVQHYLLLVRGTVRIEVWLKLNHIPGVLQQCQKKIVPSLA